MTSFVCNRFVLNNSLKAASDGGIFAELVKNKNLTPGGKPMPCKCYSPDAWSLVYLSPYRYPSSYPRGGLFKWALGCVLRLLLAYWLIAVPLHSKEYELINSSTTKFSYPPRARVGSLASIESNPFKDPPGTTPMWWCPYPFRILMVVSLFWTSKNHWRRTVEQK